MKAYTSQEIGKIGEKLAARYLKRQGYRVLHKNRHFGKNELDLVVKSKTHIAFVEVKAPGKTPRPLQKARHRMLRQLGFTVYVLDDESEIGGILDEICTP